MTRNIEYWGGGGFSARLEDEDDDEDDEIYTVAKERGVAGGAWIGSRPQGASLSDLDAKGTVLGQMLRAESITTDYLAMMLGGELVNCQVDRPKLVESKFMRFVTKLASSAPTKGREKRQIVVEVSPEFRGASGAVGEFVEVGRTDMSYDDPNSTFALPVRVVCRQEMDCIVRVSVVCSQSNMGVGGEVALLGRHITRFSELWRATADVKPVIFAMTSPACPKGSRAMLWRLPFDDLRSPRSPYVGLASHRQHISYSVPYLFRRQETTRATATGKKHLQHHQHPQALGSSGDDNERTGEDLLLARETALESRFPYHLAALIFRPLVERMEEAVAGWKQRYEHERLAQGFFASDAEALKHGRLLVRLSVVEAKDLPLLKGDEPATDYAGLGGGAKGGKDRVKLPNVSQRAQKLAAMGGNRAVQDKIKSLPCHPFVAISLEKPFPRVGQLIGHTNTEYGTRSPLFGSLVNSKLCPHSGRPREMFSAYGAARLYPQPYPQPSSQAPAFLFYVHGKEEVNKASLCFEVFQEGGREGGAVLSASAVLLLDGRYQKVGSMEESPQTSEDAEVWLPLLDKEGNPAGRLLVRVAIFASAGAADTAAAPPVMDDFDFGVGETVQDPCVVQPPFETIQRACYEWMKQAGFSGRPPREGDFFSVPSSSGTSTYNTSTTSSINSTSDKIQLSYPLEWIQRHITSLAQELAVLQTSLRLWEEAANDGRGFRSSEHKMTKELQGVPTNVHSQTFSVTNMCSFTGSRFSPIPAPCSSSSISSSSCSSSPSSSSTSAGSSIVQELLSNIPITAPSQSPSPSFSPKIFYYDVVSTGAPTAHALGFRGGGLLTHDLQLASLQKDILGLDQSLFLPLKRQNQPFPSLSILPTGPTGLLSNDLLRKLLKFEAMSSKIAVRRALVLSQALGIATTSLATKLDIMLTEDANPSLIIRTAENMTKVGFLVCFQGLISTIGKERGMLEDVAVAMEMASLFSFEIRPKSAASPSCSSSSLQSPQAHSPAPAPTPLDHNTQDLLLDFGIPSSSPFPHPSPPPSSPSIIPLATRGPAPTEPVDGSKASLLALDIEFDEAQRRVRLFLDPVAYERLPGILRQHGCQQQQSAGEAAGGLVVPLVAVLFTQGIDAKQSLANFSNQLKKDQDMEDNDDDTLSSSRTKAATKRVRGESTIQQQINRRSTRILNDYCHRCYPCVVPPPRVYRPFDRFVAERLDVAKKSLVHGSTEDFIRSVDKILVHPLCEGLKKALKRDNGMHKNVDLLREQERVTLEVGGGQVIFCKSGKDRTGMAVTLYQARLLAEKHGCGEVGSGGVERLVRDANVMRLHGTRLLLCDKNTGRFKFAFNNLQLQFMPALYKPPTETVEHLFDSIMNRDTT
ncbi:inositol bisphosphate 4- [Nannochloropsis oceanica]